MGNRRGTANARIPFKVLWISQIRVLQRILKKMCSQKKISKHIYNSLYVIAKGNQFKNKKVLLEFFHEPKALSARESSLKEKS